MYQVTLFLNVLPLQILFAISLAAGSYYLIERSFLQLKDNVSRKLSLRHNEKDR